jgi:hypothetical protein
MSDQLSSLSFWRLFHSLLRHGNSKGENDRATQVYDWTIDNMSQLRKCCVDFELDLIGAIGNLSRDACTLPSYDLVKEKINAMENNEGAIEGLKEYDSIKESQLNIHHAPELEVVLGDHIETFERGKLSVILDKAKRIANGSVEHKKRKLAGAKDAMNYLMENFEEGILIRRDQSGLNRPILVQHEAEEIGSTYDRKAAQGFLPSGFPLIRFRPSNFVGILGHAGQGKSTVMRFMLYQMALAEKNCVHISLENDAEVERDKFILLHAHNQERFGDEFMKLTYENFVNGNLTVEQRGWLDYIGKDFKQNVGGRILIRQPQEASWESCKNCIEQEDRREPVDVAGVDYIQLIEPAARNADEKKNKMTAMIREQRQYALNFGGHRKLVLISPVQGNEEGFAYAKDHEGQWPISNTGINTDKELGRSMDLISGICQVDSVPTPFGNQPLFVFSCVKDRDKPEFPPFRATMTGCGFFQPTGGASSAKISINTEETMNDVIGEEIPL